MRALLAAITGAGATFAISVRSSLPSTSLSPQRLSLSPDPKHNARATPQGWTPGPVGRGTWALLWACLSTIFACLWVAMHMNVPAATDSGARKFWRRFAWLVIGALAPEWVSWMAVDQWMGSRYTAKKMQELGYDGWTKTQAFYLNMGGFVFRARDGTVRTLDPLRFRWLIERKHIEWPEPDKPPPAWYVTESDIRDKSKADGLAKLVALLQVSWLVIQCIARAVYHLPLSTLEITTLAYVACMIFSYSFWWNKPYDVAVATSVNLDHLLDMDLDEMRALGPDGKDFATRIDNMFGLEEREERDDIWSVSIIALLTIAFGAIHLAAWNFVFPTQVERIAWRVCACIIAGMPIFFLVVVAALSPLELSEKLDETMTMIMVWLFVCSYLLSRTFIIIEVFLALRAQPPGVYETWEFANFFIHLV